tara:strand:- start:1090 stop:1287 length:198 start_codon:yes stop_codon:yes gene_type:complete
MSEHEYVWELLYHMNCGECQNWWSYATDSNGKIQHFEWNMTGKKMFCPHCGAEKELKVKEGWIDE